MTEQDKHITHIADLIIAELTGKIDDAGRNELENWKHETPEHLRLYNLYQSPDFIARKFEFIKEYSAIEAYQEFAGRVKWATPEENFGIISLCGCGGIIICAKWKFLFFPRH